MNSLQCFKDREKLIQELLSSKHNTEKVVYFLLLDRKLRNPSREDEEEIKAKSETVSDPPRKRVDLAPLCQLNGQPPRLSLGNLSEGSPVAPRRALTVQKLRRKASLQNCSHIGVVGGSGGGVSPTTSPHPIPRLSSAQLMHSVSVMSGTYHSAGGGVTCPDMTFTTPPGSPSTAQVGTAWKSRLHTIKNNFLGSPRFHRKKMQVPSREDLSVTPGSSTEFTKKSWFGALMGSEREEHCFIMIKDRNLGQIKADLIHAFLCMPDLSHSAVSSTSFRAEYKRTGNAMFSRNIRFQVDLTPVCKDEESVGTGEGDDPLIHCITFTLISGPSRRFKRLCELFQSILLNSSRGQGTARRISSDLASNSSSSSYNSMDRMSPTPSEDSFERRTHQSQILTNGRKCLMSESGESSTSVSRDVAGSSGSVNRDSSSVGSRDFKL